MHNVAATTFANHGVEISSGMEIFNSDRGFNLRSNPCSQGLPLIEIYDIKQLQLCCPSSLIGGLSTLATFVAVFALFRPTYPEICNKDRGIYTLFYPGSNMSCGTDCHHLHSRSRASHWMWDPYPCNNGSEEVLRYLLSDARGWLEEYKIDGYWMVSQQR